jgi:hypothetical protein
VKISSTFSVTMPEFCFGISRPNVDSVLIFEKVLDSKFKCGRVANEPVQLFTGITKGQGQRPLTLLEGQSKYFTFLGRSNFWSFFNIAKSCTAIFLVDPTNFKAI